MRSLATCSSCLVFQSDPTEPHENTTLSGTAHAASSVLHVPLCSRQSVLGIRAVEGHRVYYSSVGAWLGLPQSLSQSLGGPNACWV